jgi:hypothetical protein
MVLRGAWTEVHATAPRVRSQRIPGNFDRSRRDVRADTDGGQTRFDRSPTTVGMIDTRQSAAERFRRPAQRNESEIIGHRTRRPARRSRLALSAA